MDQKYIDKIVPVFPADENVLKLNSELNEGVKKVMIKASEESTPEELQACVDFFRFELAVKIVSLRAWKTAFIRADGKIKGANGVVSTLGMSRENIYQFLRRIGCTKEELVSKSYTNILLTSKYGDELRRHMNFFLGKRRRHKKSYKALLKKKIYNSSTYVYGNRGSNGRNT